MKSKGQIDGAELKMQNAVGAFLKSRRSLTDFASESGHLDEDTMSAFVEGGLSEVEAGPVISHLTDCSFCRHVSAELIRLEAVFADEPPDFETPKTEPTRVGEVLGGILERIFGGGESAVFAHEEKESEVPETDEET